jgi:hypothetical protein
MVATSTAGGRYDGNPGVVAGLAVDLVEIFLWLHVLIV